MKLFARKPVTVVKPIVDPVTQYHRLNAQVFGKKPSPMQINAAIEDRRWAGR